MCQNSFHAEWRNITSLTITRCTRMFRANLYSHTVQVTHGKEGQAEGSQRTTSRSRARPSEDRSMTGRWGVRALTCETCEINLLSRAHNPTSTTVQQGAGNLPHPTGLRRQEEEVSPDTSHCLVLVQQQENQGSLAW